MAQGDLARKSFARKIFKMDRGLREWVSFLLELQLIRFKEKRIGL